MDSCARGAFLSGVGFLVSLKWLQAARVSISAVATKRIRIDRRGALSVSMCIGWLLVPEPRRLTSVRTPFRKIGSRRSDQFGNARHHYSESGCQQRGAQVLAHPFD